MTVQPDLCRTCSETTLLVFPRGGSSVLLFMWLFAFCLFVVVVVVGFVLFLFFNPCRCDMQNKIF